MYRWIDGWIARWMDSRLWGGNGMAEQTGRWMDCFLLDEDMAGWMDG